MFLRFFGLDELIDTLLASQNRIRRCPAISDFLGQCRFHLLQLLCFDLDLYRRAIDWEAAHRYSDRPFRRFKDNSLARDNTLLRLFVVRTYFVYWITLGLDLR